MSGILDLPSIPRYRVYCSCLVYYIYQVYPDIEFTVHVWYIRSTQVYPDIEFTVHVWYIRSTQVYPDIEFTVHVWYIRSTKYTQI